MSNAEIFLYPGQVVLNFILTLFNSYPAAMDYGLYTVFAAMLSSVTWVWAIKICYALMNRPFSQNKSSGQR